MKKFTKEDVPEKFYKGNQHVIVDNVGDLIEQLQMLPKDMPVKSGFDDAVEIIVYNISDDSGGHVEFEEPDEDDDYE